MRALAVIAIVVVIVPVLVFAAGQFGLLRGKPPQDLGIKEGRLKAPSRTENSVSSQAPLWPADEYAVAYATIDPIVVSDDASKTLARIKSVVSARPGATIVTDRADYLYVQFETRWLRFVDDVEFWVDPATNSIQVRSASRIGRKDFGVNRSRIESIRASLK